jgi:hypothetical protein
MALREGSIVVWEKQKNEDGTVKDSLFGWGVEYKTADGEWCKEDKVVIYRVKRWLDKSNNWHTDSTMDPFRGKIVDKKTGGPMYNKQVQISAKLIPEIVAAIVELNRQHGVATVDGFVEQSVRPEQQRAEDKEVDKAIDGMSEFDAF